MGVHRTGGHLPRRDVSLGLAMPGLGLVRCGLVNIPDIYSPTDYVVDSYGPVPNC